MENCNRLSTPTKVEATFGKYKNGSEAKRDWTNSYDYILRMMLYLESNTRPYISFAVHQCDHFTHNTKESHETAVKRICWYHQGIKDKGLVFNPSRIMAVDYYADAEFVGLWGHENPQDPIFASSRTGFVVTFENFHYCGCQNYRQILLFLLYIMSM